jgi:hypothetical protein
MNRWLLDQSREPAWEARLHPDVKMGIVKSFELCGLAAEYTMARPNDQATQKRA